VKLKGKSVMFYRFFLVSLSIKIFIISIKVSKASRLIKLMTDLQKLYRI